MIKHFFALLLVSFFLSCTSEKKESATYFGGKVINPKSRYVLLFQQDKELDTFYLDKNNKFLKKIKGTPQGLYYFKHGNEHQYIYLEPQDSLLFRLNTWDFDESLVFSGKGAERNNMLLDCFLEAEKENNKCYRYYKLSPINFKEKIDSLKKLKEEKFSKYLALHPEVSDDFKKVLKIALLYPIYTKFESYRMYHRHEKQQDVDTQMKQIHFYSYRDSTDINIDRLMYYAPYYDYVSSYLYNEAFSKTKNFSTDFTLNLLQTIHKKIQSEEVRNQMLYQIVISHFYKNSTCNQYDKVFYTFFKTNTNIEHKKNVQRLINDTKKEREGEKLSNFKVYDYNQEVLPIYDIIKNKKSLLLFWTKKQVSNEYLVSRINYLKRQFPTINFVLINIDYQDAIPQKIAQLDIKSQFYIDKNSRANLFLTSKLTRTILVDYDGVILNSYASLSSNKLLYQLKELRDR